MEYPIIIFVRRIRSFLGMLKRGQIQDLSDSFDSVIQPVINDYNGRYDVNECPVSEELKQEAREYLDEGFRQKVFSEFVTRECDYLENNLTEASSKEARKRSISWALFNARCVRISRGFSSVIDNLDLDSDVYDRANNLIEETSIVGGNLVTSRLD